MTETTRQTPATPPPLPLAAAAVPGTAPAARVQASAARAAARVGGVHAVGSPGGRTLVRSMGRVRGGRTSYGSGVSVEVGAEQAAVDVSLVLEHGARAPQVGEQVRTAVVREVTADTGLEVVEVNVSVVDVHHPDDDVAPEPVLEPAEPEEPEPAAEAEPELVAAAGTVEEPPAPTVVVGPAGEDGATPRVVVAEQVVVADEVVVVDGDSGEQDHRPA